MCYNVQQKKRAVVKQLLYRGLIKWDERNNEELIKEFFTISGFVHPELLVIASDKPNEIQHFKWGLIPSWVKDENKAKELAIMTLNAKAETVFEKPSFRSGHKKRCVLPVDGFFEWHTIGKSKYPYFIYIKSKEPVFLGCLFDTWVNPSTGEIVNSFSIVTTEANPLLAHIHNTKKRMPVIIPEEKIGDWNEIGTTKEQLAELMKPLDENLMEAHTISKRITSRELNPNVEEVTDKFECPELGK